MPPLPIRRLAPLLRRATSMALDALAGHRCAACDLPLDRRAVFCALCARSVTEPPESPADMAIHGVGAHGGALATAIHRLKYRDRPDLARPLALLVAQRLPDDLPVDLVVPVPLHPRRLALRGYNQAALLATQIAAELGARRDLTALRRIRDTATQAQLDRATRQANVQGAFVAHARLAGARLIIVDDVATTGATLRACRAAALAAGAEDAVGAVVALTSAGW